MFQTNPEKFNKLAQTLITLRSCKEDKEQEWLDIAEKAEALEKAELAN